MSPTATDRPPSKQRASPSPRPRADAGKNLAADDISNPPSFRAFVLREMDASSTPEETTVKYEEFCRRWISAASTRVKGTPVVGDHYHPLAVLRLRDLRAIMAKRVTGGARAPVSLRVGPVPVEVSVWPLIETLGRAQGLLSLTSPRPQLEDAGVCTDAKGAFVREVRASFDCEESAKAALGALEAQDLAARASDGSTQSVRPVAALVAPTIPGSGQSPPHVEAHEVDVFTGNEALDDSDEPLCSQLLECRNAGAFNISDGKTKCLQCGKLFRGTEFAHKHLQRAHANLFQDVREQFWERVAAEKFMAGIEKVAPAGVHVVGRSGD